MKFKPVCFFYPWIFNAGSAGSLLSESSWWSIGKSDTEMGKIATKAIVMLLSGKFFTKKVVDGGVGGKI
jgi:hypothetical protein